MKAANSTAGKVVRWPATTAGRQFLRGPTCWAHAAINAAIASGIDGAAGLDPERIHREACRIDPIESNDDGGGPTIGWAVGQAVCRELGCGFSHLTPAAVAGWIQGHGAVASAIRWHYQRIGVIGTTMRRWEDPGNPGHAVALVGYDPAHRTTIFRREPAFLVLDSQHEHRRAWIPQRDFQLDALETIAFTVQ